MRRPGPKKWQGDARGQIKDMVSIRERPASVEDRAVPGHWEGDLLSGPRNSYIATLVERHTRYVTLVKVANKDTQTVVSALIGQAKKLPTELYKSLTWDRGKELTDHRRFSLATDRGGPQSLDSLAAIVRWDPMMIFMPPALHQNLPTNPGES